MALRQRARGPPHRPGRGPRRRGLAVVLANLLVQVASGGFRALPLSVCIFGAVLNLLGTGAIRFQSRLFAARQRSLVADRHRVLVVGAGSAGSMMLKDLLNSPSLGLFPVGVVDDDRRKVGRRLHGIPVLGTLASIPRVADRYQVSAVLLAIPSATDDLVRDVAGMCERAHVTLKVLPSVHETVGGKVTARDIRDLQHRRPARAPQVVTDLDAVGAAARPPGAGHRRRRVDRLGDRPPGGPLRAGLAGPARPRRDPPARHAPLDARRSAIIQVLADIRDRERVSACSCGTGPRSSSTPPPTSTSRSSRPPGEALATNVLGTANVVDAAAATGVGRFVFISTDKAVNPSA